MTTARVAAEVGVSEILARKWAFSHNVPKIRNGYWWSEENLEEFASRDTKRGPKTDDRK